MSIRITWQITPIVEGSGYSTEPSLAFSPSGQPSIAYSAGFARALRLATLGGNGIWTFETADEGSFGANTPSLRFRFNQPAVRYIFPSGQRNNPGPDQLRFALRTGGSWEIVIVAPDVSSSPSSLAIDASHRAGVSYSKEDHVVFSHAGTPWASWAGVTVDQGEAYEQSLAFSPSGLPAIAYSVVGSIKFAAFDGRKWQIETVASTHTLGGDCSLAFSPSGEPAICYRDMHRSGGRYGNHLIFVQLQGTNWIRETVAEAAEMGSLAFSPSGEPAISYHDIYGEAIKYAVFTDRRWQHFLVEQAGKTPTGDFIGPFLWTSLAFSPSGQPAISYHDRAIANIKYAVGMVTRGVQGGGLLSWLWDLLTLRRRQRPRYRP
jgi:hypothetical protein